MATSFRRPPRPGRAPFIILGVVVGLALLAALTNFYTDVLWFEEVGITSVLWTSLSAQFSTGAVVGLFVAVLVFVNLVIAGRFAPVYAYFAEPTGEGPPIERYREALTPYLRWIRIALAGGLGILTGFGASASWQTFVLYLNRVPFGVDDPQFGRDVGFYMFELPFYKLVLNWMWFGLLAALVLSLVAHYFHGSIRPELGLQGLSSSVMAHLSVLLGLLALVKAGQYWLGTYELNFSPRGTVTGASYTDVNAQLPALRLLAIISIISAVLFLANIRFRRIALPTAAVGIWILTTLLAGAVWPWWVQRFSVDPQEAQRERPFIERNIASTRVAFGLANVRSEPFPATETLADEDIEANETLLSNVRVWDPDELLRAYAQLQSITPFYQFNDVDIDRYEVDGEIRQVLLSARELSVTDLRDTTKTWTNTHLRYTHGYGIVASLANESTTAGQPDFLVRDLPGTVTSEAPELDLEQARIYYGEGYESSEYSIVNTGQDELDFQGEAGIENNNYDGEGGIDIGGFLTRFAFAVRERDTNLMLSSEVQGDSRIMIYKDVRDRVLRAAPFLSLDGDPYVAAIDGRLKWILDGYTTSPWYPYSERFDLGDVVGGIEAGSLDGVANYVRNSVKVVVDAYDGTLEFYVIDESDPLIQAWRNTFPSLFTDEEPSEELRAHFRYPEDLLKIQSEVYLTYHIDDPLNFYGKSDEWALAREATGSEETVDPSYLLISLPGESEQEFVLSRPFTPRAKNNMTALLVGRSDPDNYGELLTIDFPSQRVINGPAQINNLINQNEEISSRISLLSQRGSEVTFGSLVILPIEESLLYVQPLFIEAARTVAGTTGEVTTGGQGIPELESVVLVYGEEIVDGESFEEALAELFELEEPAPEPTTSPTPGEDGGEEGGEQPEPSNQLDEIVAEAGRLYDQAQDALQAGDFQAYGRLIEELGALLERAEQLSGTGAGGRGGGNP
ncbi:MAG: UPF0182 family protein [Actinomycetota bacterium]